MIPNHIWPCISRDKTFTGKTLIYLAYQSIGVIYGDIGTSPLYVFSSTFTSEPSYDDLVGVLSIILWSLTMMVTVKYVLVILHADNEGEGGTFSTYSLISRYVSIQQNQLEIPSTDDSVRHTSRSEIRAKPLSSRWRDSLLETSIEVIFMFDRVSKKAVLLKGCSRLSASLQSLWLCLMAF